MSLSRYYRVFGLSETATEAEIKQRYRQLAMRYHPDKQGGDDRKFIEIKEAYEYLTGKKTVSVTTQTYTSRSTSHTRQQSQEERIKQAQQRKRENEYKEYVENERYFQSLTSGKKWRFLKTMAYVGLVLSILLIIDFNLPYKYDYEFIKAYRPANAEGMGGTPVRLIYTESGKSFYVEDMLSFLRTEPEMFLVKSTIFHNEIGFVPMNRMLLNQNIEHSTIFHIHFTLGAHSRWLLLFFALPLIVISFKRRTYTFTTAYFLSLYLSCPLILIYLFTNNRWLHILTLGYV